MRKRVSVAIKRFGNARGTMIFCSYSRKFRSKKESKFESHQTIKKLHLSRKISKCRMDFIAVYIFTLYHVQKKTSKKWLSVTIVSVRHVCETFLPLSVVTITVLHKFLPREKRG